MSRDQSATDGVYWALMLLLTGYCVTASPRRLVGTEALVATRVGVPSRGRWSLEATARASANLAEQGMRPVVTLAAPMMRDPEPRDRILARLAAAGVRDLVVRHPARAPLAVILDETVRTVTAPDLVLRGFTDVTVAGIDERVPAEPSAELVRAFDGLRCASEHVDVEVDLLAPAVDIHRTLRWERAVRAHGNRLPVRTVIPADSPARLSGLSVALAAAIDAEPASRLLGADLIIRGHPSPVCHWANTVAAGRFVLDDMPGRDPSVRLLGEPPAPAKRRSVPWRTPT